MKIYCVKCGRYTENIDPKMVRTKNDRLIMQSRFVKEQEAKSLLSNLGIKTPLSKIPLLNVLSVKINEIVNKFSLAGDKFMPAMHLKQSGFT